MRARIKIKPREILQRVLTVSFYCKPPEVYYKETVCVYHTSNVSAIKMANFLQSDGKERIIFAQLEALKDIRYILSSTKMVII